jgi:hypothetical protein
MIYEVVKIVSWYCFLVSVAGLLSSGRVPGCFDIRDKCLLHQSSSVRGHHNQQPSGLGRSASETSNLYDFCLSSYTYHDPDYTLNSIIPMEGEDETFGGGSVNPGKANILGETTITCRDFNIHGEKSVESLGSYSFCKEMPEFMLPEIAFVGKSNVGKSSLLNSLFVSKKTVAPTSKNPGCTRTIRPYRVSDKTGSFGVILDLRKHLLFLCSCGILTPRYLQQDTDTPSYQRKSNKRQAGCLTT